jgi:hypothetical protein
MAHKTKGMKELQPNANNNYNEQTPTMGNTNSNQAIVRLYSLGCAMIPSSGIMSSPGDRH